MTWIVPGCPAGTVLRVLLPRLRGAGCGTRHSRCPLFHQEAMPIWARYQRGTHASAQDHEVMAGQGCAAA
jgi:hypothetical protein